MLQDINWENYIYLYIPARSRISHC